MKNNIAFVIHSFYEDLLFKILDEINSNFDSKVDFYISLPFTVNKDTLIKLNNYNCKVYLIENINRDIGPFLKILPDLQEYFYCCKISLKKSETEIIGDLWREEILHELNTKEVLNLLEDKNIGMLIPDSFALDFDLFMSSNRNSIEYVCKKLKLNFPNNKTLFSAGTMFWFKPNALKSLLTYKLDNNYEPLPQDGTELHALERLMGYIVQNQGFKVLKIKALDSVGNSKTFYETIMGKTNLITKDKNRLHKTNKSNLIIFVHYNMDNNSVKNYVFDYLYSLSSLNADIFFISNSNISEKYINKLTDTVVKIVIRKNEGYDFYAYKKALSNIDYWNYNKVILTNDTLIGPLKDYTTSYNKILNSNFDIFGMTASKQFHFHIQSFFICFDKKVTNSEFFKEFWSSVKIERNVMDVIIKYELGLTKYFADRNFSVSALHIFENDENKIMKNPLKLINEGFPFFKKKYFENLTIKERKNFINSIQSNNIIDFEELI